MRGLQPRSMATCQDTCVVPACGRVCVLVLHGWCVLCALALCGVFAQLAVAGLPVGYPPTASGALWPLLNLCSGRASLHSFWLCWLVPSGVSNHTTIVVVCSVPVFTFDLFVGCLSACNLCATGCGGCVSVRALTAAPAPAKCN